MRIAKSAVALFLGLGWSLFAFGGTAFANGNTGGPKGPDRLHGDYAFTGSGSCLSVVGPAPAFDEDQHPVADRDSFMTTFTVQGIRTFHYDGTGTVVGKVIATSFDQTNGSPQGASSHDFEAAFDYTLDHDGFLTIDTTFYSGTETTGPRTGQTLVIDRLDFTGYVSIDKKTITFATPDTAVEEHIYSSDKGVTGRHQRICHRSRVGIRIRD